MTEDNTPKPTKKTSAVPLRKETVRVTLKATPNESAADSTDKSDAPPAPAPTIPLSKPADSGAPVVPPPAPTVQLSTPASKAPSVKLQTASQAKNPVAAPTVAGSTFAGAEHLVPPPKPATLKIASPDFEEQAAGDTTEPAVPTPAPTVGLSTPATTQPAGESSQPMPVASVQLQQGEQAQEPTKIGAPIGKYLDTEIDEDGEAIIITNTLTKLEDALSVIAVVAALFLLGIQLGTANIWVNDTTLDNPGWGRLFE